MKRIRPLFPALLVLTFLAATGFAADVPAPAAPVQIQIQGGAQLQIQGGGRVQINGVQVQAEAAPIAAKGAAPDATPPVIFFPGIPSVLIPNPAADARPAYLGMQLDTGGDEFADDADDKKDVVKKIAGVGILNIVEGSPAEKAGLKEGDTVLTFEGKEAKNSVQLRGMIRAEKVGKDVKLTVRRDGKEIEIKAKLAAAPEQIAGLQVMGNGLVLGGLNGGNEPQAVPGTVVFNRVTFTNRNANSTGTGTPGDKDTVSLRDGNRFAGKIRGFVPAKGLLLQREGAADLELIDEEITGLTFAEREPGDAADTAKKTDAHAKVMLQIRDGSVLNGDALTMEHGTLLLTLRGEQRVRIPREHVQSATMSDEEGVQIFDGPSGLTGWSSGRYNQGQWEYGDGLLRCITNGPIGRDLGRIPDPLDMSFDIVFPRQMQHFGVSLFSSEVSVSGVGTLTLQFSPNQIYGSHYDGRRSNQYSTALPLNDPVNFSDKPSTVHYRLLVDRVKGSALIYINGVKRADWKLSKVKPEDIGKCGATFSVTPNVSMSNASFQVGRIRLLPWNGKEPEGSAETPASSGDTVLAGDGMVTDGAIEKITGGEIQFANSGATVRRDRTLFVRFAVPATPGEIPAAAAVVRMKNGSEFSATQVRGDGEGMTFTTRFGPEITLPFSALRELDFPQCDGKGEISAKGLDVITLTDGTQFRGKAITPIAGGSVRWKIAASKVPLEYPSANVAGIFFSNGDNAQKSAQMKGDSAMRFGNGDWLPGDFVSLDAKRLVLRTGISPELSVALSDVRSIFLNPDVSASVGDGASGADLWSNGWLPARSVPARQRADAAARSVQAWTYHDGGYSPTSAARNGQALLAHHWAAYAGAYALNLEVTNPVRGASFSVQLYNSKDERTFTITINGGRAYVYFNPGSARLNPFAAGGKRFQIEEKAVSTGGSTRLGIVLDRPAKTFRVFIAGKEIGKIPFRDNEAGEALDAAGMSFTPMFYTSAKGTQNRVAHIWLAPWDGLPAGEKREKDATDAGAKDISSPVIYLANGDEFQGTVEKITADTVSVGSDAGPLELPGKRIAWIRFPGDTAAVQEHYPHLRFRDRGLLSVENLRIEGDRVNCQTLHGQALDFPLSVVKEAVWHPLGEK